MNTKGILQSRVNFREEKRSGGIPQNKTYGEGSRDLFKGDDIIPGCVSSREQPQRSRMPTLLCMILDGGIGGCAHAMMNIVTRDESQNTHEQPLRKVNLMKMVQCLT